MKKINLRVGSALHADLADVSVVMGLSVGKITANLVAEHLPALMASADFQAALARHAEGIERLRRVIAASLPATDEPAIPTTTLAN